MLNASFASTVSAKNPMQLQTNSDSCQFPVFSLKNVSREQVYNALKQTDRTASGGTDDLSGQVVWKLAPSLCINISNIYNMSINQGCFPSLWKKANITAIWKGKGSKDEPSNFRPISILPILARVFEKMITAQLYHHCDYNGILPAQQFGFSSKSSCEIALLKATDSWISQVDAGMYVGALLIDLPKAFDSVPHQKLLN